jgi:NAD(P)-dependent dehydrogenase (short-subunit alcohol dehydrogenase family)
MKNILITGASGNLGKSVVEEFSNGDYHINITARKPTDDTGMRTAWYPDLSNAEEVAKMISDIVVDNGNVSAAIHLVGGYRPGGLLETDLEDVNAMIKLNFGTAFNIVHSLLPHYLQAGGGKFIFIGAKAAMNPVGASNNVAYALSKQMLVPLVQMINQTYRDNKITAHVLLPGTLDTELNRSLMPDADFTQWTSTVKLGKTILAIVEAKETVEIIEF